MAEWKKHSDLWLVLQEQLAPDRWLLCFKPNTGHTPPLASGWVNVLTAEWHEGDSLEEIEKWKLEDTGPLELECIMQEMRKRYGA